MQKLADIMVACLTPSSDYDCVLKVMLNSKSMKKIQLKHAWWGW